MRAARGMAGAEIVVVTLHEFSHEAMATTFRLLVWHESARYAREAATAAFSELDRIEGELSRYVESSDIARANRLADGESILLSEDATACLQLAAMLSEFAGRAFDAAYASDATQGLPLYALDASAHRLTSLSPRLHLDLGAIGKGYALDRLAALLREWELENALLESGGSTALALAPPPDQPGWRVRLATATTEHYFHLAHRALSASGTEVNGAHLIDPRTGIAARGRTRGWAFASDATTADALSTAFFVASDAEIEALCARDASIGAAWSDAGGALQRRGTMPGPVA